jgi:hypothetical protein
VFSYKFTVPPNTNVSSLHEYRLPIYKCAITKTAIYFPWGGAGLCGIQVWYQDAQLIPFTRGEFLIGNDRLYTIEEIYNITAEPFELILKGYNDDDTFEHSPEFDFEVSAIADVALMAKFLKALGFK